MPDNLENKSDANELATLVDALICGTINQAQFDALSKRLKEDPAARKLYVAEMHLESGLRGLRATPAISETDNRSVFPTAGDGSLGWSTPWVRAAMLAFLVCASAIGVGAYQSWTTGPDQQAKSNGESKSNLPQLSSTPSEPAKGLSSNRSVARITNGENLAWKSAEDIAIGSWLKPGNYELKSGNLEVTFDAGAVVYIAGDSDFEIINSNEVRLLRGSLEADVPEQAIGFKVQTPAGEITDLSTKFGVKVSEEGQSDVHVLKGLVEAKPLGIGSTRLVTLKENSALRMFPDSAPEAVEFSPEQLFRIGSRNNQSKLNFLHFSFDEIEVANGLLKNSGPGGQGRGGKIVDGQASNSWVQVEGQFGKALFFSGEGAKIETLIKGVDGNRARTLMFWVRIKPETRIRSAYSFASWGRSGDDDEGMNGHKWQIGWNPNYVDDDEGTMGAVRTEFGGGYVIGSTDLRDGRWHHITSVFLGGGQGDNVANLVRHYVDGKLESVSGSREKRIMTQSDERTLAIGEYIGAGEDFFTGYKGWIDEFYLFDEALTPSQIVQVMKRNQSPAAEEIVAEQSGN